MTPQRKSRHLIIGAALAGLLAPLAFVASLSSPAEAAPGPKPHHVKTYKVEAHLDLSGEFPDNQAHEHLYCQNGDYVVDGMWRVDHVDQANPDLDVYGDERDVYVDASYGDDVDPTEWHFRIRNNADGNAQLKLFITCLDNNTEAQHGHSHAIQLSSRVTDAGHTTVPSGVNSWDHANTCAADELAVAPGFNFTAGYGRIFRSWPTPNFRGWHWAFVVAGAPADVSVYFRCLKFKTGATGNGPHAHNLYAGWFPGHDGDFFSIPVSTGWERQYSCENKFYDKGLVGAFWIDDPFHVWWLGMDPRPKSRAYRFWNDGGGSGGTYVALLCVGSRTGKQIAP